MAKDAFWTSVTFAFIIALLILAFWPTTPHVTVAYDCSIAEISPDYPVAVQEECRKRSNK